MRGIHTKPNNGATDAWVTPPEIIAALGGWESFSLDPCCPPKMPWPTARTMWSLPENDGLKQPWTGRVWLNPPYGAATKHWLKKMAKFGNGIALVPARTEVESWFWPYIWEADSAYAIFFLRGRLFFRRPDGSKAGNAGHGSVLVAYGGNNVGYLERAGIAGRLIKF